MQSDIGRTDVVGELTEAGEVLDYDPGYYRKMNRMNAGCTHGFQDLPNVPGNLPDYCTRCGRYFHMEHQCKEDRNVHGFPIRSIFCTKCGKHGHNAKACNSKGLPRWCVRCGRYGHLHTKCTDTTTINGVDITKKGNHCTRCLRSGCSRNECKQVKTLYGLDIAELENFCVKCGVHGHFQDNCKGSQSYNSFCNKCGKYGHYAYACSGDSKYRNWGKKLETESSSEDSDSDSDEPVVGSKRKLEQIMDGNSFYREVVEKFKYVPGMDLWEEDVKWLGINE